MMTNSLHSPEYAIFRKVLVERRESAGVTQAAVAESLGVPQSFVSKYENGERRVDVVEFIQICNSLGISPRSVLDEILEKVSPR